MYIYLHQLEKKRNYFLANPIHSCFVSLIIFTKMYDKIRNLITVLISQLAKTKIQSLYQRNENARSRKMRSNLEKRIVVNVENFFVKNHERRIHFNQIKI